MEKTVLKLDNVSKSFAKIETNLAPLTKVPILDPTDERKNTRNTLRILFL